MMHKHKLAKAVASVVAGAALSTGAVSTASAHTMYNTFIGGGGTDGWVYGSVNGSSPTVDPGWVGTAGKAVSQVLPFDDTHRYVGNSWLNWAAEIHHPGDALEISQADAAANYNGVVVDLDTNKGSWKDAANPPQGWAHNTDIGLIMSHEKAFVTLTPTNISTGTDWNNFGITVFKGMDTGGGDPNHHSGWNFGYVSGTNEAPAQVSNPFGTTGVNYLTHSDSGDITFLAEAGQVYSIYLGGNSGNGNFGPTANYKLNISSAAVPIPAAVWLFGSALAGLGIFGRRKNDGLNL
jgi:hypothetical protein